MIPMSYAFNFVLERKEEINTAVPPLPIPIEYHILILAVLLAACYWADRKYRRNGKNKNKDFKD